MAVIYAIVHVETGSAYVGCTGGKPSKRYREHRCLLRGNKHNARKLQALWNDHGESAFELQVLEVLPHNVTAEVRIKAEQKWISAAEAAGRFLNGYNRASGPPAEIARERAKEARKSAPKVQTAESNEKRRLAQLGKPKGHGAKISATKQARKLAALQG